jgi:hypothetical protein
VQNYIQDPSLNSAYGWCLQDGSTGGTIESTYSRITTNDGIRLEQYHSLREDYSNGYADTYYGCYSNYLRVDFDINSTASYCILNSCI